MQEMVSNQKMKYWNILFKHYMQMSKATLVAYNFRAKELGQFEFVEKELYFRLIN